MKLDELFATAKDTMTVRRVYGEPYEKDGMTIIPAARVSGGMGGGSGSDQEHGQEGGGGGFGLHARPAGAYVVKGGEVVWRPAIDVNRVIAVAGAVVIAFLVTRARIAKARARRS
jgi:uncharacterized spore protein YtfJ